MLRADIRADGVRGLVPKPLGIAATNPQIQQNSHIITMTKTQAFTTTKVTKSNPTLGSFIFQWVSAVAIYFASSLVARTKTILYTTLISIKSCFHKITSHTFLKAEHAYLPSVM